MTSPDADPWPDIAVSKLEAASRQVDAAIRALFALEDPIAVHTLAVAAYVLLKERAERLRQSETFALLEADARLRDKSEFWSEMTRLANFLKHGNRTDEDSISGVPEEMNEAVLLLNCMLLREDGEFSTPEKHTLWLWHHAIYFVDVDDTPPAYGQWLQERWALLHAETRREKLQIGADLLARLRADPANEERMIPVRQLLPWRLVIRPTIGSSRRGDPRG